MIWQRSFENQEEKPPISEIVRFEDKLIIGDKCYRMADGSVVWNLKQWFHNVRDSTTIVVGDKAFIPLTFSKGEELRCVDAGTGNLVWSFVPKDAGMHWRGLLSGSGKIFANFGSICAFDINGKLLWKTSQKYPGQMAFVTGRLIVTGENGTFCLSPSTGKLIWKNELKGSTLAICGSKVYLPVMSSRNYTNPEYKSVSILSLFTGQEIGEFDTPTIPSFPMIVVGAKRIFVGRPWMGETHCFGDQYPPKRLSLAEVILEDVPSVFLNRFGNLGFGNPLFEMSHASFKNSKMKIRVKL